VDAEQITAWGAAAAAVLTALTPLAMKVLDWLDRRRTRRAASSAEPVAIPAPRAHTEQADLQREGQ
jgi:hypothetical protein